MSGHTPWSEIKRKRNKTGKITEWVNARIEILVPLNISPDATDSEKIEAAEEAYLDLGLPEDLPVHITWEDAS
jgi:hypothetical protein